MRRDFERSPKQKELIDRGLYLRSAALGTFGFCTRSAVDTELLAPQWLEVVQIDLDLRRRSHRLHGTRIAHISDLHHGSTVGGEYLRRCIERVNQLEVDIVVLTGDHLTIALVHNPRGVEYLNAFGVDVVFSGHTHGKTSRFPPEHVLNFKSRRFHAGMYDVGDTKLYVNRGLGRVGRMRLYSRPEITVLSLR